MGKIIRRTYRVEYSSNLEIIGQRMTAGVWHVMKGPNCPADGAPTANNLRIHVNRVNQSFAIGGVNEHISRAANMIVRIHRARIVNQFTGEVMAEWHAPAFEVA